MDNLEACIMEIRESIARIEEQVKTIVTTVNEFKTKNNHLHEQHFQEGDDLRKDMAELYRTVDVRLTRHEVSIVGTERSLSKLESLVGDISESTARIKGIALGLGMAGGAVVSILTILIGIIT
jgi:uncharacterized coiled-coil DUF342 family protein